MRLLRHRADGLCASAHKQRDLRAGHALPRAAGPEGGAAVQRGAHGHGRAPGQLQERPCGHPPHEHRDRHRGAAHHRQHCRARASHRAPLEGGPADQARSQPARRKRRRARRHHARQRPLPPQRAHVHVQEVRRRDGQEDHVRVGPHRREERHARGRARAWQAPQRPHVPRQSHSPQPHRWVWGKADEACRGQGIRGRAREVRDHCDPSRAPRDRHRCGLRAAQTEGQQGPRTRRRSVIPLVLFCDLAQFDSRDLAECVDTVQARAHKIQFCCSDRVFKFRRLLLHFVRTVHICCSRLLQLVRLLPTSPTSMNPTPSCPPPNGSPAPPTDSAPRCVPWPDHSR
mmetsp:Transcript_35572/g.87494  ORF Transcript_35572/g.87494 Transcript_35572/m.87494 type:complete len:343 (+) Transcript_35572:716-1744(+)